MSLLASAALSEIGTATPVSVLMVTVCAVNTGGLLIGVVVEAIALAANAVGGAERTVVRDPCGDRVGAGGVSGGVDRVLLLGAGQLAACLAGATERSRCSNPSVPVGFLFPSRSHSRIWTPPSSSVPGPVESFWFWSKKLVARAVQSCRRWAGRRRLPRHPSAHRRRSVRRSAPACYSRRPARGTTSSRRCRCRRRCAVASLSNSASTTQCPRLGKVEVRLWRGCPTGCSGAGGEWSSPRSSPVAIARRFRQRTP